VRVPFYKELHLPLPPFGAVRRAIRAFEPDLIHIATEATLGLAVLRFARSSGIPVVSSFHTQFDEYSRHYRIGWVRGPIWRYLRWFHNQTRETYVPSRTTIEGLCRAGFERLVLWPRGVNGNLFRPERPGRDQIRRRLGFGPGDIVIGHVGRLAPEKNVDYLALALEEVARQRPNTQALIVGDGPSRSELEDRIGSYARFVGYRTGDDLADHYAACDLFVFSSRTETFGNVVLEAMAAGLPVVALRAGGVADTIQPGRTGLLVEPDSPPEEFARAVLCLLRDGDRRRSLAAEARTYALSQSWDAVMGRLRECYTHVLGAPTPSPAVEAAHV
jgi:glycosyltransferase involved in cell wall biosynthesis